MDFYSITLPEQSKIILDIIYGNHKRDTDNDIDYTTTDDKLHESFRLENIETGEYSVAHIYNALRNEGMNKIDVFNLV